MSHKKLIDEAIAAGRVPEGITAEFLNESRDTPAIVGIILLTSLTFIVIISRLLSRILILQRFGFDDGLAAVSLVCFVVFVALCIELIDLGSGRHFAYIEHVLDHATVQRTQVLDFVAHIVYTTTLLLCRISGLAFYHRVCGIHRGFKTGVKVVFGVLVASYLPQLLLIVFHCKPVTALWPYGLEWEPKQYECLQWGVVYVTNSIISLLCDILLFGVPIAMLRMLEMPRRRKIQLGCILLPGVGVIAISVTRLVLVVVGQWETDMSWSYNHLLAVEVSEIGATLISLSVPGIKPLVDRYVLRKDAAANLGSSRYRQGGGDSVGTKTTTALSTLKLRSEYSMLGNEATGQYGTEVSAGGSKAGEVDRDGIRVTVDVHVNNDHPAKSMPGGVF